jgi:GNAT superfamily N-acetyltransferase
MSELLQQAVRQNFTEKATYVAQSIPSMTVLDNGSFVLVDCGFPSDTFNVIVARDLSTPARLLEEGVGHFMAKRSPMALWYWQDAADRHTMAALNAYGLAHSETHIAMYADLTQVRQHAPSCAGLTISPATHAAEIRQYSAVIAELFGGSDEGRQVAAYFDLLSEYAADQFPALRYYIGTYCGEVVATGSLFIGSETVGIYDIVTQADYRHKGIGSAMFGYLLDEARRYQQRYAVLQASPNGLGIYAATGFTAVGQVHTFENRLLL